MNIRSYIANKLSKRAVFVIAILFFTTLAVSVLAAITVNTFTIAPYGGGGEQYLASTGGPYNQCFLSRAGGGDNEEEQPASGGLCSIRQNSDGTHTLTADGYGDRSGVTACTMRCFNSSGESTVVSSSVSSGGGEDSDSTNSSFDACVLTRVDHGTSNCVISDLGAGQFRLNHINNGRARADSGCAMACKATGGLAYTTVNVPRSGEQTTSGGPYEYCGLTTVGAKEDTSDAPDAGVICAITQTGTDFTLMTDGGGGRSIRNDCAMSCFVYSAAIGESCSGGISCDAGLLCISGICTPPPGTLGGQCLVTPAFTAFPSESNHADRGSMQVYFQDTCPDGQYMSGLNRENVDNSDRTQIVCSPAPAGYAFPSSTNARTRGDMGSWYAQDCPPGEYLSGLNRTEVGGGDSQYVQLVCSPKPAGLTFPPPENADWGFMRRSGRDVCPDGQYMSGVNRMENGGGVWQNTQIRCSTAPAVRACPDPLVCNTSTDVCMSSVGTIGGQCYADGSCNSGLSCISGICRSTGGAGEICNPGNTCDSGSLFCCTESGQNLCMSQAPTFTVSANPVTSGGVLTADASASGISGSTFEWNWGDGTPGSIDVTASHLYRNIGNAPLTRTITLTAIRCGQRGVTTQTITVLPLAPVASFTVNPSTGPAPLVVQVDGRASSDPDLAVGGGITRYVWNWGEAGVADEIGGPTSSHTYRSIGQYTVTLTVYDAGQLSSTAQRMVTATERYVCDATTSSGVCSGTTPACGPSETTAGDTQCYECRSDAQCGTGYQCLGSDCRQGERCQDGTACPLDGRCAEVTSCAVGSLCSDGSACLASGFCAADKNICSLSADSVLTQCYVEARAPLAGSCTSDEQCIDSLKGGRCTGTATEPGTCEYARCLYERTSQACETDSECTNGDGICSNGSCNYIYDCAYGPGLGRGVEGLYTQEPATQMPSMPLGIQANGEACTKPSPGAPNNCEGVNGCLYYNYEVTRGGACSSIAECSSGQNCVADACVPGGICPGGATCPASGVCAQRYCYGGGPVTGTVNNPVGNSVANCTNEVEDGTGCVYYGNQASLNKKVNCLPRLANDTVRQSRQAYAGIPAACEVVDRGNNLKDYNCTAVDFCYYYSDGRVDCDYAIDPDDPFQRGTGCIYEPNPEGPIQCPRAFKAPTAGTNFVQCLLNPDALLPGFLLGTGDGGLSACRENADCPAGNICLDGTCFPQCQSGADCATGQVCCPPGSTIDPTTGVCGIGGGGFSCSDTTATHELPYGTRDNEISIRTTQDATCRYELRSGAFDATLNIPYSTMPGAFVTTDSRNHRATASGLFTAQNTIYTACQDAVTSTQLTECAIRLTVGNACTDNRQCDTGFSCINGFCEAPVCANAQPQGALPYAALTTGTTISVESRDRDDNPVNATCVYADTYDVALACDTSVQSCAGVTVFGTTGSTAHSSSLAGSALTLGNNSQYVRCQESAVPNYVAPVCRIPFSVVNCNADFQCQAGMQCISGRCEPPVCANAEPPRTPALPYTTTQVDLSMTTETNSTCRYSIDYFDTFSSMAPFDVTGLLSHQAFSVPAIPGWNTEYVKCQEPVLGEEQFCSIPFEVGRSCTDNTQCGGWNCDLALNICIPPVCDGAYPSGQQTVGSDVLFGITTSTQADCRYANDEMPFTDMTNSLESTDLLSHSAITSVTTGNNEKFVGCLFQSGETRYCTVPYYGPCDPSDTSCIQCPFGWQRDLTSGACVRCTNPGGCDWVDPCLTDPSACVPPPPPPPQSPCTGSNCTLQCNTLGYTFTGTAVTPAGTCDIVAIILAILSWIAWLIALLAVLSGLRAAYLYITSMGDEKRLREARAYLIYTTIGVGVAVLTFSIVAITRALLNI